MPIELQYSRESEDAAGCPILNYALANEYVSRAVYPSCQSTRRIILSREFEIVIKVLLSFQFQAKSVSQSVASHPFHLRGHPKRRVLGCVLNQTDLSLCVAVGRACPELSL